MNELQVWVDIETNGIENPIILQVAAVITDKEFNIIEEHSWVVKNDAEKVKSQTKEFVKKMHADTGLWDKLANGIPEYIVDERLYDVLRNAQPTGEITIGGSSVHFDMYALVDNFPLSGSILSHRLMDITSVRKNWEFMGHDIDFPDHTVSHEALDDIKWTITQAKTIKEYVDSLSDTKQGD